MGNHIREFRTAARMTQDQLAQAVGVRRETIVFLEKGTYSPSLQLAHKVAKIFKVTVDELFGLS